MRQAYTYCGLQWIAESIRVERNLIFAVRGVIPDLLHVSVLALGSGDVPSIVKI